MNRQQLQQQSRRLATSARVHPPFLPYLQSPKTRSLKWIPPVVAVVVAGYGAAAFREARLESRMAAQEAADREAADVRRRQAALMDAYGDRSSLEALEEAMKVYEAQGQGQGR